MDLREQLLYWIPIDIAIFLLLLAAVITYILITSEIQPPASSTTPRTRRTTLPPHLQLDSPEPDLHLLQAASEAALEALDYHFRVTTAKQGCRLLVARDLLRFVHRLQQHPPPLAPHLQHLVLLLLETAADEHLLRMNSLMTSLPDIHRHTGILQDHRLKLLPKTFLLPGSQNPVRYLTLLRGNHAWGIECTYPYPRTTHAARLATVEHKVDRLLSMERALNEVVRQPHHQYGSLDDQPEPELMDSLNPRSRHVLQVQDYLRSQLRSDLQRRLPHANLAELRDLNLEQDLRNPGFVKPLREIPPAPFDGVNLPLWPRRRNPRPEGQANSQQQQEDHPLLGDSQE